VAAEQAASRAYESGATGSPVSLHSVAQNVQATENTLANLPGVKQLGDVYAGAKRAAANAPVIRDVGNIARRLSGSAPVRWAQWEAANAPGIKQVGDWIQRNPQAAQDVSTLISAGMNLAQILPVLGLGAAGVKAMASRVLSEGVTAATRRTAAQAASDVARTAAEQVIPHPAQVAAHLTEDVARTHDVQAAEAVARSAYLPTVKRMAADKQQKADQAAVAQAVQTDQAAQLADDARAQAAHNVKAAGTPPFVADSTTRPGVRPAIQQAITAAQRAADDETGAINLQPIARHLAQASERQTFVGDLSTQLRQLRGKERALDVSLRQTARQLTRMDPKDFEAVYHAGEDSGIALTPRQQAIADTLFPIRQATEAMKASLPREFRPVSSIGYMRRFALGKGGWVDEAMAGSDRAPRVGGLLRRVPGSLRSRRTYQAAVDMETGKSSVISVADGRVTRWTNGKPEFLGTVARRKTLAEFQQQDLAPIKRRIANLQVGIRALQQAATGRVLPSRVRANAYLAKVKDLAQELIDTSRVAPEVTPEIRTDLDAVGRLHQLWNEAATKDEGALRDRLTTLQDTLVRLQRSADEVGARYNPDDLTHTVFRAKDGRMYRFTQPTTAQIEAHTGTRYLKNAAVSILYDHLETQKAVNADEFLRHVTSTPEFATYAVKPTDPNRFLVPGFDPKTWRAPRMPQFQGYLMDPKVADVFDAFMPKTRSGSAIVNALAGAMNASIQVGFVNPLVHTPNVAGFWLWDRGLTRWVNPAAYKRLAISSQRAFNAAIHMNKDYQDLLGRGAALMRAGDLETHGALLDLARKQLLAEPQTLAGMAAHLGTTVKRILSSPLWFSHQVTWLSNDMAYMQRVFERQLEGEAGVLAGKRPAQSTITSSIDAAIAETGRFFPEYQIPAHVLGDAQIANILRGRGLTIFAPYHYGVLKSYGQAVKGLLGPGMTAAQRLEAADKLALLGIVLTGTVPAHSFLQNAVQHMLGNPRARVGGPGPFRIAGDIGRVATGELPLRYGAEAMFTPAPAIRGALNVAQNQQQIEDPSVDWWDKVARAAQYFGMGTTPLSLRQLASGYNPSKGLSGGLTVGGVARQVPQVLMSPVVSQPKKTPAEYNVGDLMFNVQRRAPYQNKIKTLVDAGTPQAIRQATVLATKFNDQLYRWAEEALQDEGHSTAAERANLAQRIVQQYGLKLEGTTRRGHLRPTPAPGSPFDLTNYLKP